MDWSIFYLILLLVIIPFFGWLCYDFIKWRERIKNTLAEQELRTAMVKTDLDLPPEYKAFYLRNGSLSTSGIDQYSTSEKLYTLKKEWSIRMTTLKNYSTLG